MRIENPLLALYYGYGVFQSREDFSDSLGAGENVYLTPLFGFTNFGESAWMFCFLRCEAVWLATINLITVKS